MIYIRAYIYHNHNLSLTDFIFNEFPTLFRIRRYGYEFAFSYIHSVLEDSTTQL